MSNILFIACLPVLLIIESSSKTERIPYKISSEDRVEDCICDYNSVVDSLHDYMAELMGIEPINYEKYLQLIVASPIPTTYKWKVERTYKINTDRLTTGSTEEYFSKGMAEPAAGFITEIEGDIPIPCVPGAVGILSGTVNWEQRSKYDVTQNGNISYQTDLVILLCHDCIKVYEIDYRSTPRWDGGWMYEGTHIIDERGTRSDFLIHWGNSFTAEFKYLGKGFYGIIHNNNGAYYLPGSIREGQILGALSLPFNLEVVKKMYLSCECKRLDLDKPNNIIINIVAKMPIPTIDHNLSGPEIALISQDPNDTDLAGLTQVNVDPSPLEMITAQLPAQFGNRTCIWVHQLDIDISYPSIVVYIDRKYPVGSCNYQVTKEHELEHVADAEKILAEYAQKLATAFREAPLPYEFLPLPVSDPNDTNDIDAIAKATLSDVMDQFKNALRLRVKLRDANYDAVRAKCPTW